MGGDLGAFKGPGIALRNGLKLERLEISGYDVCHTK
jgi:hypothetical protein